jgi:two-component system nitrogen regulation sensor histidine kinase NtrY
MHGSTNSQERAAVNTRLKQWVARVRLTRKLAVAVAVAALASVLATAGALTGSGPFGPEPRTILILLNVNLVLILVLSALVLRRLVELWMERRRGSAGSRLHVRLAALFSVVAVAPVILVALFSALFLNLGIESWFSERVRTALDESLLVAEAYVAEHKQIIRADVLAMAQDINRVALQLRNNPTRLNNFVATQAALRSLTEAMVLRRDGRILARTGLTFALSMGPAPEETMKEADEGGVVILTSDGEDRVRAMVRLDGFVDSYLFVGRFVEPTVIGHMTRTQDAVSQYQRLEGQRSDIQITFSLIFSVVALLLLLVAVWVGLTVATRLVRPISGLVAAAEQVRVGNLKARVPEGLEDDEIGILSRAFNRMTGQLEGQRRELIEANRQIDARRRFTESVLSGVSAGVIGLDAQGKIELPNRSALELLETTTSALVGQMLAEAVPEMTFLMRQAEARPERRASGQVTVVRAGRARTLQVRISAERRADETEGFVVTFDDISALVVAQRAAAWSDVARRIAHEIKNPLTPIQLSAERLKRKYQQEISSDPKIFASCTDTIVRRVADIGRMVDEFTAFARIPTPVLKHEDVVAVARETMVLHDVAHPEISFDSNFPPHAVRVRCDRRQLGQALTNLIQNAIDAIGGREMPAGGESLPPGKICVSIKEDADSVYIEVIDNGRGLPNEERERLVEPYVTTRAKGTGLGLAIVKKIMEDHGGELLLDELRGGGARICLILPADQGLVEDKMIASKVRLSEGLAHDP